MVWAYRNLLLMLQKKVNSESARQTFLSNIPVDDNLTGFALKNAQFEASEKANNKCENLAKLLDNVLNQMKQSSFVRELTDDVGEKHAVKKNFEENILGHHLPEADRVITTYMGCEYVKKTEEELRCTYRDRDGLVTNTQLYKFTHHILISLYGKAGYRTEALLNRH